MLADKHCSSSLSLTSAVAVVEVGGLGIDLAVGIDPHAVLARRGFVGLDEQLGPGAGAGWS